MQEARVVVYSGFIGIGCRTIHHRRAVGGSNAFALLGIFPGIVGTLAAFRMVYFDAAGCERLYEFAALGDAFSGFAVHCENAYGYHRDFAAGSFGNGNGFINVYNYLDAGHREDYGFGVYRGWCRPPFGVRGCVRGSAPGL